ncbi:MAG: hypothetical protein HKO65_01415 [Gemmatimonadetes bacterium]|nr:hypothetical protein [Gemmatimonadota bacterium]
MSRTGIRRLSTSPILALVPLLLAACSSGGRAVLGGAEPGGTHTVMGREIYGDQLGITSARDWWVIQVEEGGEEGDRILSGQETQDRALT